MKGGPIVPLFWISLFSKNTHRPLQNKRTDRNNYCFIPFKCLERKNLDVRIHRAYYAFQHTCVLSILQVMYVMQVRIVMVMM